MIRFPAARGKRLTAVNSVSILTGPNRLVLSSSAAMFQPAHCGNPWCRTAVVAPAVCFGLFGCQSINLTVAWDASQEGQVRAAGPGGSAPTGCGHLGITAGRQPVTIPQLPPCLAPVWRIPFSVYPGRCCRHADGGRDGCLTIGRVFVRRNAARFRSGFCGVGGWHCRSCLRLRDSRHWGHRSGGSGIF